MLLDDHLYLDHVQMAQRGWTRALIARFLRAPDRWASVNHWLNYKGKATYFVERVMAAEHQPEFKRKFAASIARRSLTSEQVAAMMEERAKVEALYREWLRALTPDDVRLIVAVQAAAEAFESIRARGYRTPHK